MAVNSSIGFRSMVGGILTLIVVIAVGYAVVEILNSPYSARQQRLDEKRVNDLNQIINAVDIEGQNANRTLPKTLADITSKNQWSYMATQTVDPVTGEPYEYRVIDATHFEVCATFETDAKTTQRQPTALTTKPIQYPNPLPIYLHGVGRQCFTQTVNWPNPPTVK